LKILLNFGSPFNGKINTFNGFILLILELINFGWVVDVVNENFEVGGNFGGIATILGLSIPLLVTEVIAYLGFFKFWKDLKLTSKKNI